ncbi:hypothetical protein MAR_035753 [Mya arenaria]|uniref:Uncharacterized protein n=1 Tax=Mya arenaria TaxID=6604 RepID=A0ABY7ENZ1_MYAAR|nr:hypothetical protein MAR_035753 [Mya arenaria]
MHECNFTRKYVQHFALLSEAVYILLGDKIYLTNLKRAEKLLDEFYCQLPKLYGQGSCGLNVHNVQFGHGVVLLLKMPMQNYFSQCMEQVTLFNKL